MSKLRMGKFTTSTAQKFLSLNSQGGSAETVAHLQSDVSTGVELVGKGAQTVLKQMCESIQKRYGSDSVRDAICVSATTQEQRAEVEHFFDARSFPTTAVGTNCTCVIIKPHVVAAGLAGQVIDAILEEGFEISAMQMFTLDKPTAQEFFEIYRGVLPEFVFITEHMTTGPCIVMEVR